MKRIIKVFLITLTICSQDLFGQEFSFEMIFQDSKGNSDTLIFGYDSLATDSVDTDFGEINIISTKIDSLFDVRITDEWINKQGGLYREGNYHIKKQIIKKKCNSWPTAISVDIECNNWPVTAKWDNTIFNDTCKDGSLITGIVPGGWWDVMCPSDLLVIPLFEANQVTFSANFDGSLDEHYNYVNKYNDTISVFWVAITYHDILHSGEPPDVAINNIINEIIVYPNPINTSLYVKGLDNININDIVLFDMFGEKQNITINNELINFDNLEKGIYLLRIKYLDARTLTRKIIKY
jgi:hypothetical protein